MTFPKSSCRRPTTQSRYLLPTRHLPPLMLPAQAMLVQSDHKFLLLSGHRLVSIFHISNGADLISKTMDSFQMRSLEHPGRNSPLPNKRTMRHQPPTPLVQNVEARQRAEAQPIPNPRQRAKSLQIRLFPSEISSWSLPVNSSPLKSPFGRSVLRL